MSVTASSPYSVPPVTTPRGPTQNQAVRPTANTSGNTNGPTWNWAQDAQPTRSSYTAPGTGLVVDKLA